MKLNADLPKWIAWPLRLILYAFVMFILFNIAVAFVAGRGAMNAAECNELVSIKGGALSHAQSMVSCLKNKNGIFENLLMRSTYDAIDALLNVPKEFVGVWDATQPRCSYRHTLRENGEFISEPMGCNLSAETFNGVWGVYENQMVWLAGEGVVWPPDINPMDVVDKDFFLLVEQDGTRTKFSRVKEGVAAVPEANVQVKAAEMSGVTEISPATSSRIGAADDLYMPAYKASDPNAPLEVGVLSDVGGSPFILPILSIPLHPAQFQIGRDSPGTLEGNPLEELHNDESGEEFAEENNEMGDPGVVRKELYYVAKFNYMSSLPDYWMDYEGNHYVPADVAERDDGVVGGAMGFELKDPIPDRLRNAVRDRVVLSRADGFPPKRVVQDNEWMHWQAFTQEMSHWAKRQLELCQGKAGCKEMVDWLLAVDHIKGTASEYSLSDGGKLRYVQGESRATKAVLEECRFDCSADNVVDELQFNFWIYAKPDGGELALRSSDWFYTAMTSVGLVDHYCDTQCGANWTGQPWVISSKGQTYIIGPFSGGTVYGYVVYEVMPDKLRFVGRFAWGS